MTLGVMTKVFARPSIEEVAAAIQAAELFAVQLNLEMAGLEELPAQLDTPTCERIRKAFASRGIEISAVSGTFNAIDTDLARRKECIRRVGVLAAHCEALGTKVITLCTGTRATDWMWSPHPDNSQPEAWAEMVQTMRELVKHAEAHGVTLAFEPEVVNVVDTTEKAQRLIEAIGSPNLRIVKIGRASCRERVYVLV